MHSKYLIFSNQKQYKFIFFPIRNSKRAFHWGNCIIFVGLVEETWCVVLFLLFKTQPQSKKESILCQVIKIYSWQQSDCGKVMVIYDKHEPAENMYMQWDVDCYTFLLLEFLNWTVAKVYIVNNARLVGPIYNGNWDFDVKAKFGLIISITVSGIWSNCQIVWVESNQPFS